MSYSVTIALMIASWVAALAQDAPLAHEHCDDGIQRAIAGGYEVGLMMRVVNGWARAALGEIDDGAAEIRHATEQPDTAGNPSLHPFHLALLADTALMASRFEEACGEIDQGLDIIENTGERWIEANSIASKGARSPASTQRIRQLDARPSEPSPSPTAKAPRSSSNETRDDLRPH